MSPVPIIFIVLIAVALVVFVLSIRKKKFSSLHFILLKISVPDQSENEKGDLSKEINISEKLLISLLSIKEPFVFEAAVPHSGSEITFYASVPRDQKDFVMRQIQGLFPRAQVDVAEDYNVFSPHGGASAAYLTLDKSHLLPLETYEDSGVDSFAQILSNMSKLEDLGEGAAVQVLVRPGPKSISKNVMTAVTNLRRGAKISDVLKGKPAAKPKQEENIPPQPIIVDEDAVKLVQSKIQKPVFSVNVRLVAAGNTKSRAEDILMQLGGAYSQLASPLHNSVKVVKPRRAKKLYYKFSFREFDEKQNMILNSGELATLFHLPTSATDIPRVEWLDTKEAPPPENLPESGVAIGESIFRGDIRRVRITREDRRRHFYTIGQTGTGKSGLLQNMAVQDVENGEGVCVIDPHGDFVDHVLERIPADRVNDVIVFNPGDIDRPLGLNMLEFDEGQSQQKTFIVNELQSIFNRLFDQATMGPMFESYMRNSLLLLMDDFHKDPATLIEVPRIFTDAEFRARKLEKAKNPVVIDFWTKEASKTTGEASLSNMAPYITSKFGNFIANDYLRPIIGQTKSAFNFREIMDQQKILLVTLPKGKIGDINANLLGMIISGRILMAALARGDMDQKDRKDFYFYIDEFQNFTTDSISTILSEARKYGLSLNLAHQFIDQLTDDIRESVFGNVGSLCSFRVGSTDTEQLVRQFGPQFEEKDLMNQEFRHAAVKLLINGQPSKPFSIKTLDYNQGSSEVKEKLRELSRLTYGRQNEEVEREILRRLRS